MNATRRSKCGALLGTYETMSSWAARLREKEKKKKTEKCHVWGSDEREIEQNRTRVALRSGEDCQREKPLSFVSRGIENVENAIVAWTGERGGGNVFRDVPE